ncbi:hypothetical protein YO5_18167 [Stutzerimonas stutzeri TS44]|nr:hypothetical protein YO5_18167 [Stutzerimonas stutzeri TS44]
MLDIVVLAVWGALAVYYWRSGANFEKLLMGGFEQAFILVIQVSFIVIVLFTETIFIKLRQKSQALMLADRISASC